MKFSHAPFPDFLPKNPHFPGLTQIICQLVFALGFAQGHVSAFIENAGNTLMSFKSEEPPLPF